MAYQKYSRVSTAFASAFQIQMVEVMVIYSYSQLTALTFLMVAAGSCNLYGEKL